MALLGSALLTQSKDSNHDNRDTNPEPEYLYASREVLTDMVFVTKNAFLRVNCLLEISVRERCVRCLKTQLR